MQLLFEFNLNGLLNCLKSWNYSKCNKVNRKRFRQIQNLLLRTNINSKFEDIISHFRVRNANWWHEPVNASKTFSSGYCYYQNTLEESKRIQDLDLKNMLNIIFDCKQKTQLKENFGLDELQKFFIILKSLKMLIY